MTAGQYSNRVDTVVANIAASGTTSQSLDLSGSCLVGIQMPTAFTGTAVTFNVSADGVNFYPMYSGASAYSLTVAASRYILIPAADFAGVRYLQVVSNATEGSARALTLAVRPLY
jgi:hypothetical protein